MARLTLAGIVGGRGRAGAMNRAPARSRCVAAALLALLAPHGIRAQATVYPDAGQMPEQVGQDRAACNSQATAQSGYHPSQPPPTAQRTRPVAGQRAAAGAIPTQRTDQEDREIDDVTGAAARASAVVGGSRQRQARRQQAAQSRQEQQAYDQRQAAYDQAFAACMLAKGYTVQ